MKTLPHAMQNRVTYVGTQLDEVVTDGGAHLEHMGGKQWFLSCIRADGSEFALWFKGTISLTEERGPGKYRPDGSLARKDRCES